VADDPQPIALMVDAGGQQMTLADWLKQADSLPPDAEVIVDGKTESVAEYQAWAHEQANGMLDRLGGELNATVESLSGLGGELSFKSALISGIRWDFEQAVAGIDAAIGQDALGNSFRTLWRGNLPQVTDPDPNKGAFAMLEDALSKIGRNLDDGANGLFAAEDATLRSFGRTAQDPRRPRRVDRGRPGPIRSQ
jgi:hypothetical protein